ncbi:MAG: hypothetical protein POELPBGB_01921 [Bacteroidia bacterium]|nr:hypothetical protein [Bacteroidia bacterium]
MAATKITVSATIKAPLERVWALWTTPKHICNWNNASPDWHTPSAENNLYAGGKFSYRMEAKDGSFGFDFSGIYNKVEPGKLIDYTMDDNRHCEVVFTSNGNTTTVTETFEAETQNSVELQQQGWQAILNNFKKYAENSFLHFEISVNAPAEKVYNIMLSAETYKEWTAEFNPTSRYKGSWEKGSKILFIGTDDKGNQGGMVSRIKENIANKFVSIEHLGVLQGEQEILNGPDVDQWAGGLENYTFSAVGNSTLLAVDMDSNEAFKEYFETTWPRALNKLKTICERP